MIVRYELLMDEWQPLENSLKVSLLIEQNKALSNKAKQQLGSNF